MDDLTPLLVIYGALIVPVVGWTYLRQRRVSGFLGWSIMILGLLMLFGGAADDIDWGGLLWTFVAFIGAMLILTDLLQQRARAASRDAALDAHDDESG